MCKYCSKSCTSALILFFRFIASSFILSLFPRQWVLWEQEAASSSLATPTTRKATMNRLQMRFCRGFLCFQNPEIWLECALFVPYRPKKCFHFEDCYISYFCLTFGVHFRAGRLFFIVEIRDFSARFFQLPGGRLHPAPKCVKVGPDKIF